MKKNEKGARFTTFNSFKYSMVLGGTPCAHTVLSMAIDDVQYPNICEVNDSDRVSTTQSQIGYPTMQSEAIPLQFETWWN